MHDNSYFCPALANVSQYRMDLFRFTQNLLLGAGREEHGILQTKSIHVAILLNLVNSFTLTNIKSINSEKLWVVEIRNTKLAIYSQQSV